MQRGKPAVYKKIESYRPSGTEKNETLRRGDFIKLSGDGIFATLQGEGVTSGSPSVFVRLHDCNLSCGRNGGWRCDAWYTWDKETPEYWRESSNIDVSSLTDKIKLEWDQNYKNSDLDKRMVITGGEPLLQQNQLVVLFEKFTDWQVEIETNGTIEPKDELARCQINCSPKLSTSGNSLRSRYHPAALKKIASFPNHWFKFVVSDESDILEIESIVEGNGINWSNVILMGEGISEDTLSAQDKQIEKMAKELGCLATKRNQIFWYGDKRKT